MNIDMAESLNHLAALRRHVAGMTEAGWDRRGQRERFTTGHAALDATLGGGFLRGCMHELFAAEPPDVASASGFAAMLALRAQEGGADAPLLWFRTRDAMRRVGALYAPGLIELGGDPNRLLLAETPDPLTLLRAANDAARCAGLTAAVIESWGRFPALDLNASRRLTLAAAKSGVTLLMLRIDAEPVPSAAETRWRVAAAPSAALDANAPGTPMLDIELLRWRAGPAGMRWRVEWHRDERRFREPALSGAVVSFPAGGTGADRDTAALRRIA